MYDNFAAGIPMEIGFPRRAFRAPRRAFPDKHMMMVVTIGILKTQPFRLTRNIQVGHVIAAAIKRNFLEPYI